MVEVRRAIGRRFSRRQKNPSAIGYAGKQDPKHDRAKRATMPALFSYSSLSTSRSDLPSCS
jgi:hypothetical protein